jgi:hypothetical protein
VAYIVSEPPQGSRGPAKGRDSKPQQQQHSCSSSTRAAAAPSARHARAGAEGTASGPWFRCKWERTSRVRSVTPGSSASLREAKADFYFSLIFGNFCLCF